MNYPSGEQQGIRCHAGLDPASSLDLWIPAFAGMTIRCKWVRYEKEKTNFVPLTG